MGELTEGSGSASGDAIVEVENLVKRYRKGKTNAVDGISFTVRRGEFFAFLGPNGAGKTTTISILTTTLIPTGGRVRIAGYDVVTQASSVRARVGIIFQNPSLDMNLTGEENVRFHAILYGLYAYRPRFSLMPEAYRRQVQELAALLDIETDVFRPIKTLSGGTRRKLEIIRSLMHRPDVLFLDEPTRGLDTNGRRNLWDYLRGVQKSGTTVFLTTHYLEEAEGADSVCIINKGRIVSFGPPSRIKSELVTEHVLIDADDRDRLRAELVARGVTFAETPLFKITVDGRGMHQLLKAIETPLSVVSVHQPSLEDAYVSIIGTGDE
ncbi:MAG: ABC transporter ATP-binding protein [Candidatus Dormibacteraeota bacterium]|nr:ABC transporter ATP-binding protein [Candidatus Dormibacteraeota bacterium]